MGPGITFRDEQFRMRFRQTLALTLLQVLKK